MSRDLELSGLGPWGGNQDSELRLPLPKLGCRVYSAALKTAGARALMPPLETLGRVVLLISLGFHSIAFFGISIAYFMLGGGLAVVFTLAVVFVSVLAFVVLRTGLVSTQLRAQSWSWLCCLLALGLSRCFEGSVVIGATNWAYVAVQIGISAGAPRPKQAFAMCFVSLFSIVFAVLDHVYSTELVIFPSITISEAGRSQLYYINMILPWFISFATTTLVVRQLKGTPSHQHHTKRKCLDWRRPCWPIPVQSHVRSTTHHALWRCKSSGQSTVGTSAPRALRTCDY